MQPYFFPYIGYFQLINAVNCFVVYDDVSYIKQGWINRNKILINNKEHRITLKVLKASSFKCINQIKVECNRNKLLKTIEQAYKKAPYFGVVCSIIKEILLNDESNLAKFIEYSLYSIICYLDINTKIVISSSLNKNNKLKSEEKVIDICTTLGADCYINSYNGQHLYSRCNFAEKGIELKFIKSIPAIYYKQFNNEFVAGLSIIDVMMFNSKEQISELLKLCTFST